MAHGATRKLALAFLVGSIVLAGPAAGGDIPRNAYLQYVPLEHPAFVRETPASRAFQLFGDPASPEYRDLDPVDGMDDRRHDVLEALAVRFAPVMVQNTTSIPMDVRSFMTRGRGFPLFVDSWDTSGPSAELIGTEEVDCFGFDWTPCVAGSVSTMTDGDGAAADPGIHRNPDCRLRSLIERYGPWSNPGQVETRTVSVDRDEFQVLFFDFPGHDEASWKKEYENQISSRLPRDYETFARVYAHPFIVDAGKTDGGESSYEFVLQYWFFYPFNDGGNNHEGDWEHINVLITPLGRVGRPLLASDIRGILAGRGADTLDGPDALVIKRVDYYFHHNVMALDYTSPSVYQSREQWERVVADSPREVLREAWFWEQIRYLAYRDDAETEINTHPVAYIGADDKGTDQLLKNPGGSNRDSHGTYPFPGLYKNVGPAGAAEQVAVHFDHRRPEIDGSPGMTRSRFQRGNAESFADPRRVEVLPDWECLADVIRNDPQGRRDWFWMVLPIRWGYPAAESPFAGIVGHAETGNLAVYGPSLSGGWNRIGPASGFEAYQPHKFSSLLPTTWQDGFVNSLGFLNLTVPTLVVLPPFDFIWRVVAAPPRSLVNRQLPIFHPNDELPNRFVDVSLGVSHMYLSEDYTDLLSNQKMLDELTIRFLIIALEEGQAPVLEREFVDDANAAYGQVGLYLGRGFASQNTIRHSRSVLGGDFVSGSSGRRIRLRGDLNFWEYSGSIRKNLGYGAITPFLKAGYGLSWYRLENVEFDGVRFDNDTSPWVRKPSIAGLDNLLPNTWHAGLGFEWTPLQSPAELPRGIDVGARVEFLVFTHKLGLDIPVYVVSQETGLVLPAGGIGDKRVTRPVINVAISVGF